MSRADEPRVAIVTGATSQVGLAALRAVVERGMTAIALGRDDERLRAAAAVDRSLVSPLSVDLRDEDCWPKVEAAAREAGTPVAFVSAAAVMLRSPFHLTSPAEWDRTVDINLHALVRGLWTFVPGMVERRHGRVILVSSVGAGIGLPHRGLYTSTKAAGDALMRSLAVEYGASGVTFNSIRPGALATEGTERWLEANPAIKEATIEQIPVRRLGPPEGLQDCFGLLLDNDYITGADLVVDGGWSIA